MTTKRKHSRARSYDSCVIYTRLSYDRYGTGLGVERQEAECRALAERMGWTVEAVYTDNSVSAFKGKARPAFVRMCQARPSRIVMWSPDRLLRRSVELPALIDLDADVYSVQAGPMDLSTAAGRFSARILVAAAEWESDVKGERMEAQHRQRRTKGKPWWPTRPFGFEKDGTHRPDEAALLREGYRILATGGRRGDVRRLWTEAGTVASVRPVKDRETGEVVGERRIPWNAESVQRVLAHPRNAGLIEVPNEAGGAPLLSRGAWEPIIAREEWERVMRRAVRRSHADRARAGYAALLSGIVSCSSCGSPAHVGYAYPRREGRRPRRLYVATCRHVTVPGDEMDAALIRAVSYRLASAGMEAVAAPEMPADVAAAVKEVPVIRERLRQVNQAGATGAVPFEVWQETAALVAEQLRQAEMVAERATPTETPWEGMAYQEVLRAFLGEAWSMPERRSLVAATFSRIDIIVKTNRDRFDPAKHVALWDHEGEPLHLGLVMAGALLRGPGDGDKGATLDPWLAARLAEDEREAGA